MAYGVEERSEGQFLQRFEVAHVDVPSNLA